MKIPMDEQTAGLCLAATGFTFLFAPYYHPAMRAVGQARAALGVRTIFNILGPLTNPAAPPFYVIGAYSPEVARLMAEGRGGHAGRARICCSWKSWLGRANTCGALYVV